MELMRRVEVHGLAHITGGGAFSKLERVVGQSHLGAELDALPTPPKIFQLVKRNGHISDPEMYRTFNMGIGLVVVCSDSEADHVIRVFKKHRQEAMRIGRVEKKTGIRIEQKRVH